MPNLIPRAALKGAGHALMEKFALPSERKALQQFGIIHDTYNTPFSAKAVTERLGQGGETADDLFGNALNSRLLEASASLEGHAPETQQIVERVYKRIQNKAALLATGAGIGAASLASPDEAEAGNKERALRRGIMTLKKFVMEASADVPEAEYRAAQERLEDLYSWWNTTKGLPGRSPQMSAAARNKANKEYVEEAERVGRQIEGLFPTRGVKGSGGAGIEPPASFTPPTPNTFEEFERELDYIYDQVEDLSPQDEGLLKAIHGAVSGRSKEALGRLENAIPTQFPEASYKDTIRSAIKWFLGGAAGVAAGGLLAPKEAEAAPRIRLSEAQLSALKEAAFPVAKDLLKSKGPVEFDISRRTWSKRLGSRSGHFWDRKEDQEQFLKWVNPWVEKAGEVSPEASNKAKFFIELGKKEERPQYFEIALQYLHRIFTHDTPAAEAVTSMISTYGDEATTHALLQEAKTPALKEALSSTLDYWKNLVALSTAGLAGLGLADPKEAEAGKIPKLPTLLRANKALREAQAKGGLKGLLEKVEELVPQPDYAQGRVHGKVADAVKEAPFARKIKPLTETVEEKMGNVSSASRKLMGMELMDKTIKEVRKGNEPWRYVLFEDGTYLTVHKKYISSLTSSEGEKLYGTMFEMSEPTDQKLMLARSHALKMADKLPGKVLKQGLEERRRLLSDLGEEAPSRVATLFRGKRTEIPTLYKQGIKEHGDQSPLPPERLAPPRVKKEAEVRLKDIVGTSIKAPKPVKEIPRTKSNLERAIYNLEKAKATKGISKGDEYMLRRFQGMSPEEAAKGLKLLSPSSIERMVLRILEEAKK